MHEHESSESENPSDPSEAEGHVDEAEGHADTVASVDATDRVDGDTGPAPAAGDAQLDGFESDLDGVAAALDALDADDLDRAEALVAGLDSSAPVDGESQG